MLLPINLEKRVGSVNKMRYGERDESLEAILERYNTANEISIAVSSRQIFNALRDNLQMQLALKEAFALMDAIGNDFEDIPAVDKLRQNRLYLAYAEKKKT